MRLGSLCTGIGGLDLGVSQVFELDERNGQASFTAEVDRHASTVLKQRGLGQRNVGDITIGSSMTRLPWVEILTAGFPCQDISLAGKGAGLNGERSGLWFDVLHWIRGMQPQYVVLENVPAIKTRGLDVVLDGLTQAGYGGLWCFYRSGYYSKNPSGFAHVGGCHQRKRWFLLAERKREGFSEHKPQAYEGSGQVEEMLPTPHANMATGAGRQGREGGMNLQTVAALLPTPTSRDHKGRNQRDDATCLPGAVSTLLPTPTATDSRGSRNATSGRKPGSQHHGGTTITDVIFSETWDKYAKAVERWANVIGAPPPEPSIEGRLNPELPEWMLGYPKGYVTDLDISRTQMLKMLGNAVQPQVATAAVSSMLKAMQ